MKTLIKNGQIVTAESSYIGDILIENEKIILIGRHIASENKKVINASGRYVLPGAVDVHTHMDLDIGSFRTEDDFYTGTVAAACGGTTTIVDHIPFGPKGASPCHQLEVYRKLAEGKAVIDYGLHGVVQCVNNMILKELEAIMSDGIPSVKVYMTYDGRLNDAEILSVLEKMNRIHGVTAFHCENHDIITYYRKKYTEEADNYPFYHAKSRPNLAEAEAVERVLKLAKLTENAPSYIVHLSTKEGLDAISKARDHGQKNIIAETCPQYLILTEEWYKREDGIKYIISPPLRTQADCDALWRGVVNGDIQTIASDHCPFNYEKKKQHGSESFAKCPNGIPGVEERMILIYSEGVVKGKISLNQMVRLLCSNPAKVYGLYPQKGTIQVGADADIVILNPDEKFTITKEAMHGRCDYTAYEGMCLSGRIDYVLQRGRVIVKNNQFLGQRGEGRFIFRRPYHGME